ncbi:uncharacterized protein WCC33_017971 [Rhinophrynus dorsalis]
MHNKGRGHDQHNHNHSHEHGHDHSGHKHPHHKHHHHHGKGKHHDHHGKGKHHHHHHEDHHHHQHSNESMPCHKIAPSNARFAFNLFKQVASQNPSDNIFFSPVSISTAFAMLSLGAKSQTFNQIIEALGFNISEISVEDINEGFHHLIHMLDDPDSELKLSSGNALFIDKDLKLIQKFLDDAEHLYESEAISTDFQNEEEAKKQINSYVEKKTNGKIVDLIDSVDPRTALILINYIYFRGEWEKPFDEQDTKEGEFHVDSNTVVTVPMMRRNGMYNVAFDNELGCTVVEIPYKGNATSLFILPDEGKLEQVQAALEKRTIMRWKKLFYWRSVDLTIPKFSVSATLDLQKELTKMGVTDVFSDNADLSGIVEGVKLMVSKAVHKAVLSVDEKGTEAAAATAIEVMPMSLPPVIIFNRPFMVSVYSRSTRSSLFLGRISNPKKIPGLLRGKKMRIVFWCVSIALLCVLVFGDHHHHDKDHGQDDHNQGRHKHDHRHGKGKHLHHKDHHHLSNESTSCHKIAPANAKFAFNLFRQVASENPSDNIFLSPVGISTAFAMLSLGAKSQTFNQIIEGLGFNISEISVEDIHAGFHSLLHKLNDEDSELKLSSGNALFIDKDLKLIQKFLDDAKNFYESEAISTDFQDPEEAKKQINSYVEKKTNGKIVDLLSSVDPRTVLYIINYIYFRGAWENPFNEEVTREGDFHVDEQTVVKVPMMSRTGFYNLLLDDYLDCTVLEIPYKGNATALFILPNEVKIQFIEKSLNQMTLDRWKKAMKFSFVEVLIPKFTISATLDLKAELSKMGVTDVFSDHSDLSGIAQGSNLKVSKAVHKAVLSVDEKGTEAAAATAIEMTPDMLLPVVAFNKPFLLLTYSESTEAILFTGRVKHPKK